MEKVALSLFISTLICCWVAFGLGTSAVGSKNWIYSSDRSFNGLWLVCDGNDNCAAIATNHSLNAVRAMVILGILFGFVGTNLFSTCFWKRGAIKYAGAGIGFINLAALFWTIGMTVYTVTNSGQPEITWGYPFAFGWAIVGLFNVGGLLGYVGVAKRKQQGDDCIEENIELE